MVELLDLLKNIGKFPGTEVSFYSKLQPGYTLVASLDVPGIVNKTPFLHFKINLRFFALKNAIELK